MASALSRVAWVQDSEAGLRTRSLLCFGKPRQEAGVCLCPSLLHTLFCVLECWSSWLGWAQGCGTQLRSGWGSLVLKLPELAVCSSAALPPHPPAPCGAGSGVTRSLQQLLAVLLGLTDSPCFECFEILGE